MPNITENIMTKIAIWCRADQTNIIGIGPNIPWHVASDFKRFRRITNGKNIVAGQTTYESFPSRTLPNRKIFVLTFDEKYQVSDPQNHLVVTDIKAFKDFPEDLYICGGASVYKLFMEKQAPDIIVDSCFYGKIDSSLEGSPVDITYCVEQMQKNYKQVSLTYDIDDIKTAVYIKKGEFIDQSVLKHIITAIEE